MHEEQHPKAGQTVILNDRAGDPIQGEVVPEVEFRLEDWADRVMGQPVWSMKGNPAAMHYQFRAGVNGLPPDNECVYGKIGPLGHIVHISELGE